MKGLPLPFDFEGKGVLDPELLFVKKKAFFTVAENIQAVNFFLNNSSSFGEPTSVLDTTISGGPTSSSTLSACGGRGASTKMGVISDANPSSISSNVGGADSVQPYLNTDSGDWVNVLSTAPPSQEHSILRWITGDIVEHPVSGHLNKAFQISGDSCSTMPEFEFGGGFGVVDQEDPFGQKSMRTCSSFPRSTDEKTDLPSNVMYSSDFDSSLELKPPIFNMLSQHQTHNPSFILPFHKEQTVFRPPQAKRPNLGGPVNDGVGVKTSFQDSGQLEMVTRRQQQQLPHHPTLQGPFGLGPNPRVGLVDDLGQIHQQKQLVIINHLYNVAELVQKGNFVFAQEILARLNHLLSPIGKPFDRAALYCKEALQLLLNTNISIDLSTDPSPFSLIFKIAAYKSFSEISPFIEFSNFTCNQVFLESFEGFDRIHIVDFDIGLGGQWASLMQELGLMSGVQPVLKITALVPSRHPNHDHLELCLVRENLIRFASEINIEFEFEVMSIDSFHVSDNEAVGVNLPGGCLSDYNLSLPLVLRFLKQMSPRIVVTVDRGCDRTDLPFADHIIHVLQSYSNLLESVDAVNANMDAMQKIERFLIQPGIEKIVTGRFRWPEKSQHWKNLFMSSGFLPVAFSDFTESQGECVVKRTPVLGFQVEKRQSSLVLCWQRKELVSVSVWRC